MARSAVTRAAEALHARTREHVGREKGHALYGEVTRTPPRLACRTAGGIVLDEDDLILSQWAEQYEVRYGIEKGDTLLLLRTGDDFIVTDVLGDTDLERTFDPIGPAGGDLTGEYPDPEIAPNAVTGSKIASGTVTAANIAASAKDPAAGTAGLRTLGSGAQQAAAGADARFPTAGEKAALAGTAGTPSASNRYVTEEGIGDASATAKGVSKLSVAPASAVNPIALGVNDPRVPAYVTVIPASPVDGQEIYFAANADQGIVWHLRYRASALGDYKWDFLGGPPLFAAVATAQTTNSTSYADLVTTGPDVTVPLAGDYRLQYGLDTYNDTVNQESFMSVSIGGAAASDDDTVKYFATTTQTKYVTLSTMRLKTLTGGSLLRGKYRVGGGNGGFAQRWLSVTPVRLI